MAHKNIENPPGQDADPVSEEPRHVGEFESAVTTEISDVLARAFDEDQTSDPDAVKITDAELRVHVDAASDETLEPGFLLKDRFEIVELVHSGGMGHVYKAVDHRRHPEGSGQIHVAIKMMRRSVASQEEARLSLEREAAKAQRLSHPNIINIFDFDDHDGQFFLVMEWLEGESANALLRRTRGQRLAPGLAWQVIEGAAAGVQHAHRNNIVHADINPSNIFITDTREIKLLDFGVARYAGNPEFSENDRFAWVTQPYASPQVLSGLTPVVEDDVFSLGCVAYRLLSGQHAFGGATSLLFKHREQSVEPVAGLSSNEWDILARALSFERADRPASVAEFVDKEAGQYRSRASRGRLPGRFAARPMTLLAAAAVLVILIGSVWFLRLGNDVEPAPSTQPSLAVQPAPEERSSGPALSAAAVLAAAAAEALDAGRAVGPDENNARALFRQALLLEPDNADALRGVRAISDDFLGQAQAALNSEDLQQAYSALNVATETDPANPAIDIVDQLLRVKGDSELAAARLAYATGNLELATERLTRAEQYAHIDAAVVDPLHRQIEESRLEALASEAEAARESPVMGDAEPDTAEPPIVAGSPDTTNELTAEETTTPVAAEGSQVAVAANDAPPPVASEDAAATVAAEAAFNEPADLPPGEIEPLVVAAAVPQALFDATVAEEPAPQATPTAAELDERRGSVQEFGIQKYVAPRFPRRARMRGLSGTVDVEFNIKANGRTDAIRVVSSEPGDVFAESAVDAVRQWRFAPRDETVPALITLRFELEQ